MNKVAFLVGSPRRNGNTMQAARKALEKCESYGVTGEILFLGDYSIKSCLGCSRCRLGDCILKDDMDKLAEKLIAADTIVLATPVYMVDVPGIVKIFMDRTAPLRYQEKLKGKKAAIITNAECTGHEITQKSVANFMLLHGMKLLNTAECYSNSEAGSVLSHGKSMAGIDRLARSIARSRVQLARVGMLKLNPGFQCFFLPFVNGNWEACWRIIKTYLWPRKPAIKSTKCTSQT